MSDKQIKFKGVFALKTILKFYKYMCQHFVNNVKDFLVD